MKATLLSILCIFSLVAKGQHKEYVKQDSLIKSVTEISSRLFKKYYPNQDSLNTNCVRAITLIKFNISRSGKFTNIAYTKNTPRFIVNALMQSFEKLQMSSSASLGRLSKSTFIIPFYYDHNIGCNFPYGSDNKNERLPTESEKLNYSQRESKHDQIERSIMDMDDFTDGNHRTLDCILLSPIIIGATMW